MTDVPPGARDPRLVDVPHQIQSHGPAASLAEAARMRGTDPAGVIKTMVVRRGDDDYVFVLVPGDRVIDWPKLRARLGKRRLSLADGDQALAATGYAPGTITPLGSKVGWPVLADERIIGAQVSIGAGRRGWSIAIEGMDLTRLLSAAVSDLTKHATDA